MPEGQETPTQPTPVEKKPWDWTDEQVQKFVNDLSALVPPKKGNWNHQQIKEEMKKWVEKLQLTDDPAPFKDILLKGVPTLLTRAGWRPPQTLKEGSVLDRAMKDIKEVEAQVDQQVKVPTTSTPNVSTTPTK